MNLENTIAQMRKGVLEYCILSILKNGEAYPSDILLKLKKSNLIVVEGTLYPLLTRLKDLRGSIILKPQKELSFYRSWTRHGKT